MFTANDKKKSITLERVFKILKNIYFITEMILEGL